MTNAVLLLATVSMKGLISEAPKAQFSPTLKLLQETENRQQFTCQKSVLQQGLL